MISVTVSGRIDHSVLENIFRSNVQNVSYTKFNKSGNVELLSVAGSSYFLRTNDTIGFILLSLYDGSEQQIDFGRIGGGTGVFNIRLGAGDKIEQEILFEIKQAAENAGLNILESGTE
jgi:hypothetical protein